MDNIDYERLRNDLLNYFEGAFFVAGFGAAAVDAMEVRNASDEELIKLAIKKGFRIEDYIIYKKK